VTFIVSVTVLLLLEKYVSVDINEKTISKIQKQYAQLLLDKDFSNVTPLTSGAAVSDYEKDVQIISGLSNYVDNFSFDLSSYVEKFNTENIPFAAEENITKSPALSREEMASMRLSSAERLNSRKREITRNVESVGLLGLISSTSRTADQEYVQDLLEYATNNSEKLQNVLSKLDRIKKPHYGNGLYAQKLALRSRGANYMDNLKGERKTADVEVEAIIRNMAPLQKAKREVVARNTGYEDVPSSSMASVKTMKKKVRRDAKSVMSTIRSHLRSLQDCYKSELRENPSLRGKVVVRFTVNPEGSVIATELISSTFNNARLESCLLGKIRRWRDFPPCDPSVGNQTFRQTFKFGM
jgi:TonB family protein